MTDAITFHEHREDLYDEEGRLVRDDALFVTATSGQAFGTVLAPERCEGNEAMMTLARRLAEAECRRHLDP